MVVGDGGLRILEGRPGDAAEVRRPKTGPPAASQVLAAVDGLVWDGRKANAVRRTVLESRSQGRRSGCSRPPGGSAAMGWMAEADGVAAPAVELLKVEAGVAPAEEVAPEPEASRRREVGTVRQEVVDDLGLSLTAHPLQVGDVVAVA